MGDDADLHDGLACLVPFPFPQRGIFDESSGTIIPLGARNAKLWSVTATLPAEAKGEGP
jgi:hypothetical protein